LRPPLLARSFATPNDPMSPPAWHDRNKGKSKEHFDKPPAEKKKGTAERQNSDNAHDPNAKEIGQGNQHIPPCYGGGDDSGRGGLGY
jgi:hypothetical protein